MDLAQVGHSQLKVSTVSPHSLNEQPRALGKLPRCAGAGITKYTRTERAEDQGPWFRSTIESPQRPRVSFDLHVQPAALARLVVIYDDAPAAVQERIDFI